MRLTLQKIKFESLVLISGIIEMILLIIFQFYPIELFPLLIQSLQITIVMFISRRFFKQYLTMGLEHQETKLHELYFGMLLTINIVLIIIISFFYFKKKTIEQYILYSHTSFSLLISILLLFFGKKILNILKANIVETQTLKKKNWFTTIKEEGIYASNLFYSFGSDNKSDVVDSLIPNEESDTDEKKKLKQKNKSLVSKTPDIHSEIRQKQLFLIVFTNLCTDLVEFVTHSLRLFVFYDMFENDDIVIIISGWKGYVIYTVELFCLWFSSLANYLTFYFIVRNSFVVDNPRPNSEDKFLNDEIQNYNEEEKHKNKDIDNYLSE